MLALRDTLEICELSDLGFSRVPFTYDNKQAGRHNVKVRLDRAVADNSWRDIFPEAKVVHHVSPCSDHCLVVLQCIKEVKQQAKPCQKRYEIFWETDNTLPEKVRVAWAKAGAKVDLGDIRRGLRELMAELHLWSKARFGSVVRELEKSRSRLEELMSMNADRNEKGRYKII